MKCLSFVWLLPFLMKYLWVGKLINWLDVICVLSFYVMLTNSSVRVWVDLSRSVETLECIQLLHDIDDTPLLPPDYINSSGDISYDGIPRSTRFKEPVRARQEYNRLRKEKLSVRRVRQFVFGAMFDKLFPGHFIVDPMYTDKDLRVTLPDKKGSLIHIRMVAPYEGVEKDNLLTSLVEVGRTLSGTGNCRGKDVGDLGSMHAIGLKSATSKSVYVTSESTSARVEVASTLMMEWMQDNLQHVLAKIKTKDSEMKVEATPSLKNGPGSRMMVSVNLANSPHYDKGDTSLSVAIWVEEKPGHAQNWYFVFPNMSHGGSKGVVVKLYHGLVIVWDGREIFHCTSKTRVGVDNKVYGCLWSSTRK